LQLYYDFSGYTDLAMGVAQWFGIELPDNFRRPYWSASLREFWKRWHITFSSWLKDYLYRSLPRPKGWSGAIYFNLILTMMLSGLWHGLSWTFLVWGTLHGVGLAAGRFVYGRRKAGEAAPRPSVFRHSLFVFLTFQYVCLAWLFFRAASLREAGAVLTRIASGTLSLANITLPVLAMLGVAVLGHALPEPWYQWLEDRLGTAPFYLQGAALAAIVLAIQWLSGRGAAPFVYGGF
jgi:D-alanyl-lipoteichoic acid acyltransferase DltB (MBOAT superfamily)